MICCSRDSVRPALWDTSGFGSQGPTAQILPKWKTEGLRLVPQTQTCYGAWSPHRNLVQSAGISQQYQGLPFLTHLERHVILLICSAVLRGRSFGLHISQISELNADSVCIKVRWPLMGGDPRGLSLMLPPTRSTIQASYPTKHAQKAPKRSSELPLSYQECPGERRKEFRGDRRAIFSV